MGLDFKVTGLYEAEQKFNKMIKDLGHNNREALTKIGHHLTAESVKLAPLDTGALRASGASVVTTKGDSVSVFFAEEYALKQHEHVEYEHPHGGEAKFLEKPFNKYQAKYILALAEATRRAVD